MKEHTPLIQKTEMPSALEYLHPVMMGAASLATVIAGFVAISVGADKVKGEDGTVQTNPFFGVAMANSATYVIANGIAAGRIYQRRACTWAQMEQERRAANELTSVVIGR